MIVLKANSELKNTFETLIKTIGANVIWNGRFVAIDNYLVLQGEVRSLFFHFDSRKVVENIIELPIKEEEIKDTSEEVEVRNVINMILYAFGKWGTIKGLRVEKNYEQLGKLFSNVLSELYVEPDYTMQYFRFYKEGMRITYEDVIQLALEAKEKVPEEVAKTKESEEGLWHKVVWKKAQISLQKVETTLDERKKGRLGNNFYKIGYLCPRCKDNLHMVVYPERKKFKIETEEGTVLIARAFTCVACGRFYTARPWKMFSEGDIYTMDFEGDHKAYEDYLELLGEKGDRVSNHEYNEYADGRRPGGSDEKETVVQADEPLEELCEHLLDYSMGDFNELQEKVEEGFFPEESIAKCEKSIAQHAKILKKSQERQSHLKANRGGSPSVTGAVQADGTHLVKGLKEKQAENSKGLASHQSANLREDGVAEEPLMQHTMEKTATEEAVDKKEAEEVKAKYEAKFQVLHRLSNRQIGELKAQLQNERKLPASVRTQYIEQIQQRENAQKIEKLKEKAKNCADKNYAIIKRVYKEIEQEQIPVQEKESLLAPLREQMKLLGEREVKQMMEKIPPNLDRTRYKGFVEKLKEYEGVDLSRYETVLREKRQAAEVQEVANTIKRARKNSREDLVDLVEHLKEQDFSHEALHPYLEKLEGKIRQLDEEAIAELVKNPAHMTFDEGMQAYESVEQGNFLPDLKANALELLEKRLAKIKTDESELLVKKLQEELGRAGVAENQRHHFYPARRVLLKQASPEETEVIDYAMASYAAGKGVFEYPVCVVDTSRNESGKEGMILTPEHLYYSTLMTSYGIAVASIESVTASTGLLNKGVYVRQKNGNKTKIPYAVDTKELTAYAKVLDEFIKYLQEKPESRQVSYLAKEKHETICCFRCGYRYKGGSICPKCGFKNNG